MLLIAKGCTEPVQIRISALTRAVGETNSNLVDAADGEELVVWNARVRFDDGVAVTSDA